MGKILLDHEIRDVIQFNLKSIRKVNQLSQQTFADRLKIKRARVGAWEEKRGVPSFEILIRICDHFNIEIKDFLTKRLCFD